MAVWQYYSVNAIDVLFEVSRLFSSILDIAGHLMIRQYHNYSNVITLGQYFICIIVLDQMWFNVSRRANVGLRFRRSGFNCIFHISSIILKKLGRNWKSNRWFSKRCFADISSEWVMLKGRYIQLYAKDVMQTLRILNTNHLQTVWRKSDRLQTAVSPLANSRNFYPVCKRPEPLRPLQMAFIFILSFSYKSQRSLEVYRLSLYFYSCSPIHTPNSSEKNVEQWRRNNEMGSILHNNLQMKNATWTKFSCLQGSYLELSKVWIFDRQNNKQLFFLKSICFFY